MFNVVRPNTHEIDPRCLAISKIDWFSRKLYCIPKLTLLGVLTQAYRSKDIETEVRVQGFGDQKKKKVKSGV